MTATVIETLVEDLDHEARVKQGVALQVADLVYLVGDGYKQLGHVKELVGAGLYVVWPHGKHLLHTSADLVLVASF